MKNRERNSIRKLLILMLLFVFSFPLFADNTWKGTLDGLEHNAEVLAEFDLNTVPDRVEIGFTDQEFPNGLTLYDDVESKKAVILTPLEWGENVSTTSVRAYYQIISKTAISVFVSAGPLVNENDSSVKLAWSVKDIEGHPTLDSSLNISTTDSIKEHNLDFVHAPTGENGSIGIAGYADFEIEVKGENYVNVPVGNYYAYIYLSIVSRT